MTRVAPIPSPRVAPALQVLAAVTAAALALVLAPTPASALTAESIEYQENLTRVTTPTFAAVDPSVPLTESLLGRGTPLHPGANSVPLPLPAASPGGAATGVLARITLMSPASAVTVSIPAGPGASTTLLNAPAGATVSTTTLLPISGGGVTLSS
ncbi:MAG: hypothetical protein KKF42_00970, partial [Actinobacteria bacterium]|nr:hypothetical protein [Actinomycetota bacterium]